MGILIKGGVLVTPKGSFLSDLRVHGEKIQEIGPSLRPEGETVYPAKGMFVFPGFIDTHTHFDLDAGDFSTADDFASGTKGAIAGGTTTILDFATPVAGESLMDCLERWHRKARGRCSCDYGFHMSFCEWNPQIQKELPLMTKEGITSYKAYMAYDHLRVSDSDLFEILKAVQREGGILGVHCENGELIGQLQREQKRMGHMGPFAHPLSRPAQVEAEAVYRLLTIADMAKTPVNIVHVTSKEAMELIERAQKRGQPVFAESCPQYFLLEESAYDLPGSEGAKFVLSPPLRTKEDQMALWKALQKGSLSTIGTDHCSFHYHTQKKRGIFDFTKIPNGIPGVEHRAVLMYTYGVGTGRITKEQFCNVLSEGPARLFGMYPKKGCLQVGSDADLVIWDPKACDVISRETQIQKVDYTPYEGFPIRGKPIQVFLRGNLVYQQGGFWMPNRGVYQFRKKTEFPG